MCTILGDAKLFHWNVKDKYAYVNCHTRLFTARIYMQNKPQSKKRITPHWLGKHVSAFGECFHSAQYIVHGSHPSYKREP